MRNVTITLDEATVALARKEAARRNVSLSRYVSDLLNRQLTESRQYELAMRRSLARKPVRLRADGRPYPTREEAHERTRLR